MLGAAAACNARGAVGIDRSDRLKPGLSAVSVTATRQRDSHTLPRAVWSQLEQEEAEKLHMDLAKESLSDSADAMAAEEKSEAEVVALRKERAEAAGLLRITSSVALLQSAAEADAVRSAHVQRNLFCL